MRLICCIDSKVAQQNDQNSHLSMTYRLTSTRRTKGHIAILHTLRVSVVVAVVNVEFPSTLQLAEMTRVCLGEDEGRQRSTCEAAKTHDGDFGLL